MPKPVFETKKLRARDLKEDDQMLIGDRMYRVGQNRSSLYSVGRVSLALYPVNSILNYPEDLVTLAVPSTKKFVIYRETK